MNLSTASKATRVSNAAAAGQTAVTSSSVDMKQFEAAEFIVAMGVITAGAVTSAKLQGSHDDSTFEDLADTAITIADDDDNQLFVLDCGHPQHRYLKCVVSRATQDSVVDSIVAIQYLPDSQPVEQPATTTAEFHHAPSEGTA